MNRQAEWIPEINGVRNPELKALLVPLDKFLWLTLFDPGVQLVMTPSQVAVVREAFMALLREASKED